MPGNLDGEEGAPARQEGETGWDGRWIPTGWDEGAAPWQGAPAPTVLPACSGQSQCGHWLCWTWAPRDGPDTQTPSHSISPTACPFPRLVPHPMTRRPPAHVGMVQPWEGGVPHASAHLDRKDVSRSTQKHGLGEDQHTRSLWIFLFPLFLPPFSPACFFAEPAFMAQPDAAAPRCGGKTPSTSQCTGPDALTPHTSGGPVAKT